MITTAPEGSELQRISPPTLLWTAASQGEDRRGLRNPRDGYSRRSPPPDPPFGGCSSTRPGGTLLGRSHKRWLCAPLTGDENRRKRNTEMIQVTVEIREGALTYRVRVTATSIERALEIAGEGKPGRRVRLVFPIDPEVFFLPAASRNREAA